MAYVPPHLRQKPTSEKPSQTPLKASRADRESCNDLYSPFDLYCHFWPHTHKERIGYSAQSTLNASSQNPSLLKYVILHFGSNPRWKSDGIIFVKSNLTLLPEFRERKERAQNELELTNKPNDSDGGSVEHYEEEASAVNEDMKQQDSSNTDSNASLKSHTQKLPVLESQSRDPGVNSGTERASLRHIRKKSLVVPVLPIDYVPSEHPPIAAFEQIVRLRGEHQRQFAFVGWYLVSQISLLAPNSQELVRMLGQKWTKLDRFGKPIKEKERDEHAWKASLNHEWAVIKLQKMKDEISPLPPHVEHIENVEHTDQYRDAPEHKSVNELLAEMRLRDKEDGKVQQDAVAQKEGSEVPSNE